MSDRKIQRYIAAAAAAVLAVCVPVHPVPAATEKSAPVSETGTILKAEPDRLPEEELNFVTTKVERGTMSVTAQAEGSLQYFDWGTIYFDTGYESAAFVQFHVKIGDYVEKGDPVAEYRAQLNEIDVESAKLRLSRAKQEQTETHESCGARLASAERAVRESTGTALRIAELDLEKCRMETERSLRSIDERVAELEAEVEKYNREQEKLLLCAPMSGYIYFLEEREPGAQVWNGDRVGLMYGRQEQIFSVQDNSGIFCYGMHAQITEGSTIGEVSGKVVSCSSKYLSSAFQNRSAYIRADVEGNTAFLTVYRASITYETLHLENVLMVNINAIKSDSGGSYVTELKDGRRIKHYFITGKRTKEYCHVIDGLAEGMVVLMN